MKCCGSRRTKPCSPADCSRREHCREGKDKGFHPAWLTAGLNLPLAPGFQGTSLEIQPLAHMDLRPGRDEHPISTPPTPALGFQRWGRLVLLRPAACRCLPDSKCRCSWARQPHPFWVSEASASGLLSCVPFPATCHWDMPPLGT